MNLELFCTAEVLLILILTHAASNCSKYQVDGYGADSRNDGTIVAANRNA